MKIVHAGWFQMGSVHGTHQALWQLARAHADAGHEVTILNLGWDLPQEQVDAAAAGGVRLVGFACPTWNRFWADPGGRLGALIETLAPDIVHLQYVRIPKFAAVSRVLVARGVPYVVSLHGGLKTAEMQRHYWQKQAYWHLVERRVHARAAAIHFVTRREQEEYYRTLGRPRAADAVIANIVEPPADAPRWKGAIDTAAPTLVSLGRYDIWHKGLDLAAAMVRALRQRGVNAQLHLYGAPVGRYDASMEKLKAEYAELPVVDNGVVTGVEKYVRLAAADCYLQYSRFELFGMSLVEAAAIGVPLVVSENCDLASELAEAGAALRIPMDPVQAADAVAAWLARPDAAAAAGARAHAWRASHCTAAVVGAQMLDFYTAARRSTPAP